jgi:hypothetical protein
MNNTIPDNPQNVNIKLFVIDPLSVIIKLAILGNKPIGTKILIQNNILYFQDPGPFQSICRYVYNTNKTDLQYLYNPIEIACLTYLSKDYVQKTPRVKNLFVCAKRGLDNLIETYKNSSIIRLCLYYFSVIISNHLNQHATVTKPIEQNKPSNTNAISKNREKERNSEFDDIGQSTISTTDIHHPYNDTIFRKDGMSVLYTKELIESLQSVWSLDKISIVLDLIRFLDNSATSAVNVRSLETIATNIDVEMATIFARL